MYYQAAVETSEKIAVGDVKSHSIHHDVQGNMNTRLRRNAMANIATVGPQLVLHLARQVAMGKSRDQILAENEAKIREYSLSFSSIGQYSLEMGKILASLNKEVDAAHVQKVKEMLDTCIKEEWSEDSKVRVTMEVIRTSNQQNLMSKATPALLGIGGTIALLGIARWMHKKPKSSWFR